MTVRKRMAEGFRGQRLVVLPAPVRARAQAHPLLRGLVVTDAGIFLQATAHFIERVHGAATHLIITCLAGRGWVRLAGATQPVWPGTFIWLPANHPHAYGADDDDPWTIEWVHFTGAEVEAWRALLGLPAEGGTLALTTAGAADLHLGQIWALLDDGYSVANLAAASGALRTALAAVGRRHTTLAGHRSAAERVAASLAWMKQHLAEPLRLAELASYAGLSVPHYAVLFRRQTGFSPMDWFNRQRVQQAGVLLDTTRQTVAEIGRQVGFADPYYFTRSFRRIVGLPPRQYRRVPKG